MIKITLLSFATALCKITGCLLSWLRLRRDASIWLLLPARISLALFAWLLTLYPAVNGRVHAAYGGVYVCTALIRLRIVDGIKLTLYNWTGTLTVSCGILIIVANQGRVQEHKPILSIRYEEVSTDKKYFTSSFADHSWHKYTPFFVITPAFFDLHTCMIVAQPRRLYASRQAMQGIEHEDRKG